MIIIQLAGGLGNQMFQYALYLQLKSLGKDVRIDDVSGFVEDKQRDPALGPFGVAYERATKQELRRMLDSSPFLHAKIRRKLCGRKKKAYFEADKHYMPEILGWDDIYLEGYWQTEKYFQAVAEQVRQTYDTDKLIVYLEERLLFKEKLQEINGSKAAKDDTNESKAVESDTNGNRSDESEVNGSKAAGSGTIGREADGNKTDKREIKESKAGRSVTKERKINGNDSAGVHRQGAQRRTMRGWLERIASTESVSVHIRRGDYLLQENQALFGGICTEAYYWTAMEEMQREHPGCVFYLFTNDRQWAAEWTAGISDTETAVDTASAAMTGKSAESGTDKEAGITDDEPAGVIAKMAAPVDDRADKQMEIADDGSAGVMAKHVQAGSGKQIEITDSGSADRTARFTEGRKAVKIEIVEIEDIPSSGMDRDYAEFVLMSRCRHNILANSSYSWWASYLNRNPGRTVLAPDRWLNGWDCEDIYRGDMRRLPVGDGGPDGK